MKNKIESKTVTRPQPLSVDIQTAAELVGMSRAQFYRVFLKPGLVQALKSGIRDRIIDYGELQTAYAAYRDSLERVERAVA